MLQVCLILDKTNIIINNLREKKKRDELATQKAMTVTSEQAMFLLPALFYSTMEQNHTVYCSL